MEPPELRTDVPPIRQSYPPSKKIRRAKVDSIKSFQCELCKKSFKTKFCLKQHEAVHNKDDYICKKCGKKYHSKRFYNPHVESHSKDIKCNYCSWFTNDLAKLCKHEHDNHIKEHRCVECDFVSNSLDSMRFHQLKHTQNLKKSLICHLCNKKYCRPSILENHIAKVHLFKCIRCGEIFQSGALLKQHINDKHNTGSSKPSLACNYCNKQYSMKTALEKHVTRFHTLKCKQCDQTFHSEMERVKHINDDHSERKCEFCEKVLAGRESLNEHVKEKHIRKIPLKCGICDKKFEYIDSFGVHCIENHVGQRFRFKCIECDKIFKSESMFLEHDQIHNLTSNNDLFECHVCNIVFDEKSHLLKHYLDKNYLDKHEKANIVGSKIVIKKQTTPREEEMETVMLEWNQHLTAVHLNEDAVVSFIGEVSSILPETTIDLGDGVLECFTAVHKDDAAVSGHTNFTEEPSNLPKSVIDLNNAEETEMLECGQRPKAVQTNEAIVFGDTEPSKPPESIIESDDDEEMDTELTAVHTNDVTTVFGDKEPSKLPESMDLDDHEDDDEIETEITTVLPHDKAVVSGNKKTIEEHIDLDDDDEIDTEMTTVPPHVSENKKTIEEPSKLPESINLDDEKSITEPVIELDDEEEGETEMFECDQCPTVLENLRELRIHKEVHIIKVDDENLDISEKGHLKVEMKMENNVELEI